MKLAKNLLVRMSTVVLIIGFVLLAASPSLMVSVYGAQPAWHEDMIVECFDSPAGASRSEEVIDFINVYSIIDDFDDFIEDFIVADIDYSNNYIIEDDNEPFIFDEMRDARRSDIPAADPHLEFTEPIVELLPEPRLEGFEDDMRANDAWSIEPFNAQEARITLVSTTTTSVTLDLFFNPRHDAANNYLHYYDYTRLNPPANGAWVPVAGEWRFGLPRIHSGRRTISGLTPGATYNFQASVWCGSLRIWMRYSLRVTLPGQRASSWSVTNITETGFTVNVVFPVEGHHGNILEYHDGTRWHRIAGPNATSRSYTVSGLRRGASYHLRFTYWDRVNNRSGPDHRRDVRLLGAVTLRFESNGGTGTPAWFTLTRAPGQQMGTLPPTPTPPTGPLGAAHRFAGWFNTPARTGGTRLVATSIVPNVNTTYWARWERQLRVVFNPNGGIGNITHVGPFWEGQTMNARYVPNFTRSGYLFLGWYTTRTPGINDTPVTFPLRVCRDYANLYARWQRIVNVNYENLVNANTAAARTLADNAVSAEVRRLFLDNFGINLVHVGTRTEPLLNNVPVIQGRENTRNGSLVLNVVPSNTTTVRFRFVDYPLRALDPTWGLYGQIYGIARPISGMIGQHRLGDMVVSSRRENGTLLSFEALRLVTVHEISHVLGHTSDRCTSNNSACVMFHASVTPARYGTFNHWCMPCRNMMLAYINRWLV